METKKTPSADLTRKSGMFLNLGLAIAVGASLAAFEWKSFDDGSLKDLGQVTDNFEELLDIPITEQPPPPPPPPVEQPIIEEIPDEVEIEEKIEVNFDVDVKEATVIKEVVIAEAPVEEKVDKIFDVVETAPEPAGGYSGWNKYLNDNLKYPTQARRMGVEGTVIVVFVVNTDGSLQDIEVLRGIGAGGLDEEALRVIKNAPKWSPGKQRGKPVRTRMRLPIRFKLS